MAEVTDLDFGVILTDDKTEENAHPHINGVVGRTLSERFWR